MRDTAGSTGMGEDVWPEATPGPRSSERRIEIEDDIP
jgi:hypothetical protein